MKIFSTKKLTRSFILIIFLCTVSIPVFANENAKIIVNEQIVHNIQSRMAAQGTLIAQIKPIADLMGAEYRWNEATRTVTIIYKEIGIAVSIGNNIMEVRNRTTREIRYVQLPVSPSYYDRVAYFPVRIIFESLGTKVIWDRGINIMHIMTPDYVHTIFTVTFHPNGATSGRGPDNMRAASGSKITLPNAGSLTRKGFFFGGWNTSTDGKGVNYNAGSLYSTDNRSVILYAVWIRDPTQKSADPASTNSPLLKTFGGSIGTSFATPALIGTIQGTFASVKNLYFELGFDFGLLGSYNSTVRRYFSLFPFANLGLFTPFKSKGGWYIGIGTGYMYSKYTFFDGVINVHRFPLNLTTGFNFGNIFNISYTLRTNFKGANNKLSVGFVKRFF